MVLRTGPFKSRACSYDEPGDATFGWHAVEWWAFYRIFPAAGFVSAVFVLFDYAHKALRGISVGSGKDPITHAEVVRASSQNVTRNVSEATEWKSAFRRWVVIVVLLVLGGTYILYAPVIVWVSSGTITISLVVVDCFAVAALIAVIALFRTGMMRLSRTPGGKVLLSQAIRLKGGT